MSIYMQDFKSRKDIIEQYRAPDDALKNAKVYLAWYGYGDYSGDSLVIFEKDSKLYEVHGSHCSCNGLEGQWEPEETSWKVLGEYEIYGYYEGSTEATKALKKLVKKYADVAQVAEQPSRKR